jgi:hypothetical protein
MQAASRSSCRAISFNSRRFPTSTLAACDAVRLFLGHVVHLLCTHRRLCPLFLVGEGLLEKIPLDSSRLSYEEIPKGLKPADVWKCSDKIVNMKKVEGCHLEIRMRAFAFETEAW